MKKGHRTLHLNNENNLQNIEVNHYEYADVLAENNDIHSDFKDILDNYGQLY